MTRENFDHLLIMHHTTLAHIAHAHTSHNEDAQDLLQDTLLLLLEQSGKYNDVNFCGWGYTLLHNLYRNRTRQCNIIDYVDNLAQYHHYSDDNSIGSDDIEGAINQLSPPNATAIKMYLNGYQYNEIASQLNISIGTVKSRIARARTQLKAWLKEYR